MLKEIKKTKGNAIALLKTDHDKVKDLFKKFNETDNRREKKTIVSQAIMELKLHATVEEEIFYPAVRKPVGKELMTEADEEHHVAKVLIAEIEEMDGTEEHFDAKFTVLAENVKHHIKEEEGEMFPKAKASKADMSELAERILDRKAELKKNGVEQCAEEKMVARMNGKGDSSAMAAEKYKIG